MSDRLPEPLLVRTRDVRYLLGNICADAFDQLRKANPSFPKPVRLPGMPPSRERLYRYAEIVVWLNGCQEQNDGGIAGVLGGHCAERDRTAKNLG